MTRFYVVTVEGYFTSTGGSHGPGLSATVIDRATGFEHGTWRTENTSGTRARQRERTLELAQARADRLNQETT